MELKNKVISFLGDSLTEGVGVSDRENNRFDNIIKRESGLKAACNFGIGGTMIAHKTVPSEKPRYDLCFCGRAYDLCPESDIIIVFGGTNDFGHGDAPIGELSDKTPKTFCGGVEFLMSFIKLTYPDSKLVFMTPPRRFNEVRMLVDGGTKTLKMYVDIIKAKAKEHGIYVIDVYEKLGIDPNLDDDREKYTTDGLHLNDAGHRVLADLVKKELEALS